MGNTVPDPAHVTDSPPNENDRHRVDVLAEEFASRLRCGEHPTIDEYARAHPEYDAQIREIFPTIASLEGLRGKRDRASGRRAAATAALERLGDLRIVREIGRGGMGVVYEAHQESLGRRVAVKVLPKQSLLDDKYLQRFQREARTAAQLHHTNIVPVLGVGQHDGYHYYVMQYIDGTGLGDVIDRLRQASHSNTSGSFAPRLHVGASSSRGLTLREADSRSSAMGVLQTPAPPPGSGNGESVDTETVAVPQSALGGPATSHVITLHGGDTPPPSGDTDKVPQENDVAVPPDNLGVQAPRGSYCFDVARIGLQVASALHYAHSHGTLHRDIKPSNLILDTDGTTWVADFGLAKAVEQDGLTRSGDIVGTLRYMAPEQLRGKADRRSDVYSLGLTLYELLTLRPAHDDQQRKRSLVHGGQEVHIAAPRKWNPAIPADLETIVLKSLAEDPDHRYATAGELAGDLQRFLEHLPIMARRSSVPERLWRWAKRNPAVAALSTLAATLLVVVAVVSTAAYLRTNALLDSEQQERTRADQEFARANGALERLSVQHQRVQETLQVALAALNRTYEKLVPETSLDPVLLNLDEVDDETYQPPAQPTFSHEAAEVAEEMLKVFDQVGKLSSNSQLRQSAARASRRVAYIYGRLGRLDDALTAYDGALSRYRDMAQEQGSDVYGLDIAQILNERGTVLRYSRNHRASQESYAEALDILTSSQVDATDKDVRYQLARTYYLLSHREPRGPGRGSGGRGGRGGRGPGPRRGGPDQMKEGGPPDRQGGVGRRRSGGFERWSEWAQIERQRATYLSKAIQLLRELRSTHRGVAEYHRLLALCYRERAGRDPFARSAEDNEDIAEAIGLLSYLVEEFPNVDDFRYDLCSIYARVPHRLRKEQYAAAESQLRKALSHSQQLDTKVPAFLLMHIRVQDMLGNVISRNLAGEGIQQANTQQANTQEANTQADATQLEAIEAMRLAEAIGLFRQAIQAQTQLASSMEESRWLLGWRAHLQEKLAGLLFLRNESGDKLEMEALREAAAEHRFGH